MATHRYTAAQILTGLQHSQGMLWVAAKHLGCAPETVLLYGRCAAYGPVVPGGEWRARAELTLWQALPPDDDTWDCAFGLTPLGHERGAGARQAAHRRGG